MGGGWKSEDALSREGFVGWYARTAIRNTLPLLELLRFLLDVLVGIITVILRLPLLLTYWLRLSALLNTHDDAGAASAALLAASLLLPAALLLTCPTYPRLALCTLGYIMGAAAFKRQRFEECVRRARFDCAAAA
ncbi:hypothetical protein T484DRAFT_1836138 [Baffinella frigidus]|nr:hypothetical protein T484DRAFT_1836138 [Cryptophyta sp. CCMP2293]